MELFESWPQGLFEGAAELVAVVREHVKVACLSNSASCWPVATEHLGTWRPALTVATTGRRSPSEAGRLSHCPPVALRPPRRAGSGTGTCSGEHRISVMCGPRREDFLRELNADGYCLTSESESPHRPSTERAPRSPNGCNDILPPRPLRTVAFHLELPLRLAHHSTSGVPVGAGPIMTPGQRSKTDPLSRGPTTFSGLDTSLAGPTSTDIGRPGEGT